LHREAADAREHGGEQDEEKGGLHREMRHATPNDRAVALAGARTISKKLFEIETQFT
jgi:hypothetical protein